MFLIPEGFKLSIWTLDEGEIQFPSWDVEHQEIVEHITNTPELLELVHMVCVKRVEHQEIVEQIVNIPELVELVRMVCVTDAE